jgi:hypothetical protein
VDTRDPIPAQDDFPAGSQQFRGGLPLARSIFVEELYNPMAAASLSSRRAAVTL